MVGKVLAKYEFGMCPGCGSTKRLAGDAAERAKKKGLFDKDASVVLAELKTSMIDIRRASLALAGSMVVQVRCAYDMCTDCGMLYGYLADESEVPIEQVIMTQLGPPPGGGKG